MPKQIITIEVHVDQSVIDEHGEPGNWDWENFADYWFENAYGSGSTNSVGVINASPVRQTAAEIEEEINSE